jgi:hypothetical protein
MKHLILVLVVLATMSGCAKKAAIVDPARPVKSGTHIVELYKVLIDPVDFNLSTFGNPLMIHMSIRVDGESLPFKPQHLLEGNRGERLIDPPIRWVVDFSPKKNYQLVLEEYAFVATAYGYEIPKLPRLGYWPFGENGGALKVGKKSVFYFRDKVTD